MNRQFTPVRPFTRASETPTLRTPLRQCFRSCDLPLSTRVPPRPAMWTAPVPRTPEGFRVVIGANRSRQCLPPPGAGWPVPPGPDPAAPTVTLRVVVAAGEPLQYGVVPV